MQSIRPGLRLSVRTFCNMILFHGEELLAPRPTFQAGGPPLVGCLWLLQYICNYPPHWRPFFHPQAKDAPCRGDRDPFSWTQGYTLWVNKITVVQWCRSSDHSLRNSDIVCNNAQTNPQFLYLHSRCIQDYSFHGTFHEINTLEWRQVLWHVTYRWKERLSKFFLRN